jgi:hypothetical protein
MARRYTCDGCRVVYTRRAMVKHCLACGQHTCYRCQQTGPHRHTAMDQARHMAERRAAATAGGE